ncbi:MAG: glycosyl/methyltransferase hybrid protein [Parcubacteria group bacterium]|nr:glycosyl/methyltransferase hybrid protein [Parcubacteria group bacterium]
MIRIILPVFNRKELTLECLASLSLQTYKDIEITVIDDGSTDGSVEEIRRLYPKVNIVSGPGGWWWAKSVNMGLQRVLLKSIKGDAILIMNNDTEVKPEYIAALEKISREHGAVVGSLVKNFYDEHIQDAGIKIDWNTYSFPNREYDPSLSIKPVDALTTRGMLVPAEVFEKTGLFTPLLPHHAADMNFSLRAKRAGSPLLMSYEAVIYSKEKHGEKAWPFLTKYFSRRSSSNLGANIMFALLNAPTFFLKIKSTLLILARFIKDIPSYFRA